MNYEEFQTSTGKVLSLRGRSYDEWEKDEDERISALESVKGKEDIYINAILGKINKSLRSSRLEACVKDFAEHKCGLSLREITEIEEKIVEMESLGNLNSGGHGQ